MKSEADRYLDSSRVLREIENAERNHQLDDAGVIEELTKACVHCETQQKHYSQISNAYLLAKVAYIAEIHRRTVVPNDRGKKIAGVGFAPWCRENKFDENHARRLLKIAHSPDQEKAIADYRAHQAMKNNRRREITLSINTLAREPLALIKKAWWALSPIQRQAFIHWTISQSINEKMAAD